MSQATPWSRTAHLAVLASASAGPLAADDPSDSDTPAAVQDLFTEVPGTAVDRSTSGTSQAQPPAAVPESTIDPAPAVGAPHGQSAEAPNPSVNTPDPTARTASSQAESDPANNPAPAGAAHPATTAAIGPTNTSALAVPGLGTGLSLPQVNSRTLAAAAPVAMTGLMLAPMLLSALAGGGSGARSGSGSAVSSSPTVGETAAALGGLGDTYGTGTTDPATADAGAAGTATHNGSGTTGTAGTTVGRSTATSTTGSATVAAAAEARLYQRTVATSFHNLDVQLANYMARLAGSHGLDRAKLMRLLHDMDAALADVGTAVYTAAGRQRVHDILTIALQKGQYLVTGTAASASETAAAINQLTAQYVYNINGRDYTPSRVLPTTNGTTGGTAGKAISVALSELGKPYVYGATGPDSFDCSGLTQYAARAAGVQIPRTSQEQYRRLPGVAPADIRPGDLIFPATSFTDGAPTHVMMYLGNGKCVAAPHTGANVRIQDMPTRYSAARWT